MALDSGSRPNSEPASIIETSKAPTNKHHNANDIDQFRSLAISRCRKSCRGAPPA
jgi:hypothetical protein